MSLNPFVALTDKFEKLITEHGSATIQSKHIALLKDQFAFLEKENAKINAKLDKFISKNQILRTENKTLKSETAQLKKKIQSYEKPAHNASHIKERETILLFLANNSDMVFPADDIASECGLSEHKTLYHIEKLEKDDMITASYSDDIPFWSLDDDGRAYLIEKNLLS